MKKLVVVGLIVALGIGVGGPAFAQYGNPGGRGGSMMGPGSEGPMMGPGHEGRWQKKEAIQLNPEQIVKLKQLRLNHWEETKGLRIELFTKHEELKGLYLQSEPDQKAIEKLQQEIFGLRQKLQQKNFAFRQEMQRIAPKLRTYERRWGDGDRGEHRRGPRFDQGCGYR